MTITNNLIVGQDSLAAAATWGNVLPDREIDDTPSVSYKPTNLTFGTAAGQANVHYYQESYTIAALGMWQLNLASLTDPVYSGTMAFARIKRIWVSLLTTTTASSILVGVPSVLDPTAAPALTSATGTLAAGTWYAAYSFINASGETKISPVASISMDGAHQFSFGAITLPAGATGVNYYVSLVATAHALAFSGTNGTGNAYAVTAAPATTAATTPQSNTTGDALSSMWYRANGGLRVRNGCTSYLGLCQDATGYTCSGYLNIYNEDAAQSANVQLLFDGVNV